MAVSNVDRKAQVVQSDFVDFPYLFLRRHFSTILYLQSYVNF